MTTEERYKERELAIRQVLRTLQHPLAMMCVPDRKTALDNAVKFHITAVDLINAARERAQNT
jgi:hypothetical protein